MTVEDLEAGTTAIVAGTELDQHADEAALPWPSGLVLQVALGSDGILFIVLSEYYRRLGKKTESPTGNPSPAPTHPHRTHDTTDQWYEAVRWLGRFWRKVFLLVVTPAAARVQRPTGQHRLTERETSVITMLSASFGESMESPLHPKVRSALQKYGFREFMILSSLKNRLRSHMSQL